jgi:hypothetical protein
MEFTEAESNLAGTSTLFSLEANADIQTWWMSTISTPMPSLMMRSMRSRRKAAERRSTPRSTLRSNLPVCSLEGGNVGFIWTVIGEDKKYYRYALLALHLGILDFHCKTRNASFKKCYSMQKCHVQ